MKDGLLQLRTGVTEGALGAGGALDAGGADRAVLGVTEVAGTPEVLVTLGAAVDTLVVGDSSEDGVPAAPATG